VVKQAGFGDVLAEITSELGDSFDGRLFRLAIDHFDHGTQPVLIRGEDGCEAEGLFRRGNRGQHLSRPGHWPLGRNEYQPDHGTGRKQRGRYDQASGDGDALQLAGNPLAILAAKDNGDRIRELQPLRTRRGLGLDDQSHWPQYALS
jgi:hypothetical protein